MVYTPFTNEKIINFSDSTSSASDQDVLITTVTRDSIVYVQRASQSTTGGSTQGDVYLNGVKNGADLVIATDFITASGDDFYGFQAYSCPSGTEVRALYNRGVAGGTATIEVELVIAERN